MKLVNRHAAAVGLFSLLAAQNAPAFYDPSLQRWLNRDPIEEEGGRNVNAYLHNNPVSRIDADGRASLPFIVAMGAIFRCGVPYYVAASLQFDDDKMRHCYAACTMARDGVCGLGLSFLAGLVKELGDVASLEGWDPADWQANKDGWNCAGAEAAIPGVCWITRWFRKSCMECCFEKGYSP